MGVCHYARYINEITASGSASGSASGMHWGTDQVITLSVKLGEGVFGAHPYGDHTKPCPAPLSDIYQIYIWVWALPLQVIYIYIYIYVYISEERIHTPPPPSPPPSPGHPSRHGQGGTKEWGSQDSDALVRSAGSRRPSI